MEVQGKVKFIGETQTFGANGFRKREIVVTTDEQYPQHIMVEFVQDKTDLLNNYQHQHHKELQIYLLCLLQMLLSLQRTLIQKITMICLSRQH